MQVATKAFIEGSELPWPAKTNMKTAQTRQSTIEGLQQSKSAPNFKNINDALSYRQANPLGFMYTGRDLMLDKQQMQQNYMSLIFGGRDSEFDNIDRAYTKSLNEAAEAPVESDSLLANQKPMSFHDLPPTTPQDLLETFADQRQYYKGVVDSDIERALKSRATHETLLTTYYGKRLQRLDPVHGQAGYDQYSPIVPKGFAPDQNISAYTGAYNEHGGRNPLAIVSSEPLGDTSQELAARSYVVPMSKPDYGNYYGRDADLQTPPQTESEADKAFANIFKQALKKRV